MSVNKKQFSDTQERTGIAINLNILWNTDIYTFPYTDK